MAPSSSPGHPGANPDRVIDLAVKILMFGYALLAAWKVATQLNPDLQVLADLQVARIRAKMATTPETAGLQLAELPAGAARPLYDDTR